MKKISMDQLPVETAYSFLVQKVNILMKTVEESGLLEQFNKFVYSEEINEATDLDDVFESFAKKYPEKFYIVPKDQRYEAVYICINNNPAESPEKT